MTATTATRSSLFEPVFAIDEGYPGIIDLQLVNNRAVTTIHWVRNDVPASTRAPRNVVAFCGFSTRTATTLRIAIKDENDLPGGMSICAECALYR